MEIRISKINEAGNSSKESVFIRVDQDCNLKDYLIMDSTYDEQKSISNINRHIYWFSDQSVKAGDAIFLYTGKGKDKVEGSLLGGNKYIFYWGSSSPIWNDDGDEAFLVKIDEFKSKVV